MLVYKSMLFDVSGRLHCHGLDLRNVQGVEEFCKVIGAI